MHSITRMFERGCKARLLLCLQQAANEADALLVATQSIRQAEVVILNALKARITALDLARYRDTF